MSFSKPNPGNNNLDVAHKLGTTYSELWASCLYKLDNVQAIKEDGLTLYSQSSLTFQLAVIVRKNTKHSVNQLYISCTVNWHWGDSHIAWITQFVLDISLSGQKNCIFTPYHTLENAKKNQFQSHEDQSIKYPTWLFFYNQLELKSVTTTEVGLVWIFLNLNWMTPLFLTFQLAVFLRKKAK